MCCIKVLFILVIVTNVLQDSAANIPSSIAQRGVGSCSFTNNDTCGYGVISPWGINQGQYLYHGLHVLLRNGQDDDFYALFEPKVYSLNVIYSMTSPLLPGGIACLSFYYTIPAAMTTLHVRTRTDDNVTVELWNMTGRGMKNWTRVDGLVVENIDHFVVEFVARIGPNVLIGVDSITIERFTCENGYQPIEEDVLEVCAGHSNHVPKCEPVECGNASNAANAFTEYYNGTSYKSYAEVTCNDGYRLINGTYNDNVQEYIQCLETGLWNMSSGCELKDCGPIFAPQHGNVSYTTTTYGSSATISCLTGYLLNGRNTSRCDSSGYWNSTGQTCTVIDCGYLMAPQHGNISHTTTTYGSTAVISCLIGYILHGSGTSTCLSNGLWTSSGHICTPVDCGNLTAPEHGSVSHDNTTYGSSATISCQTEYFLNGSAIATCDGSGYWNNTGQTCDVIDCGYLTAPQHGNVSHTNFTYGSTATISCQTGYILRGSGMVTCDSSGNWNSTGQTCSIVDCGYLPAPQHGSVSHTTTTYGSTATISCPTGYFLNGSVMATCDSSGRWNSTGQTCTPVDFDLNKAIRAGCSNIGWNISVDLLILQQMYPSVSYNNIYFGETSCTGSLSRNILQYAFGFQDCLTNEKISGEAIIYENNLIYATFDLLNPHIIRNHVWTYTIECDVIRREATSSHIHHEVNTHHSSVVVHNNISLGFYSDPSFTREIPGNPLHASIGGTIYVKVYTTVYDWSIKMRLHSCYTKPWQNSNSTLDYMLINDGCEVDANTHIMSQSAHETTFLFQDFEYSDNAEGLDVFCNATFCRASDFTPTCLQACNLRP